jgi:hypothetical protein
MARYIIKSQEVGTKTKYKVWDKVRARFIIGAEFSEESAAERACAEWEKSSP